jgi:uncharacterized protein (UPF0332 family)
LKDNALHDFSASRAYYTMFYIAQAFLLGEELSYSSHAGVIAAFGQQFSRTGRLPPQYHRFLIDASQVRTQGDYSIESKLTADQSSEQILHAEQFIEFAKQQLQ